MRSSSKQSPWPRAQPVAPARVVGSAPRGPAHPGTGTRPQQPVEEAAADPQSRPRPPSTVEVSALSLSLLLVYR